MALLGRDLGLTLTIPAGFPAVDVNSLRYKDLIQDLVLVGRDPDKFDAKYATLLTAPQRDELRDGPAGASARRCSQTATITGIELVLGREEAVVGRVQDLTLQVGNDFVQRYYSNLLEHVENDGHRVRRGPERARQAGAHRLRGDALRAGDARPPPPPPRRHRAGRCSLVCAALWGLRLAGYGYLLAVSQETRRRRSGPTSPSRR